MKHIVLDTNIYLHYKDVEQIDWKTILTNSEDFEIIVPSVVIEEVDLIKDTSKGKIQKKAKNISAKFGDYFLTNNSASIINYRMIALASDCVFEQYRLNQKINDDAILASVLASSINISDVIIVSADNNILIKAKNLSIAYHKIDNSYKLQEELSEEEKESIKLKKELDEFKNRMSRPSVKFTNGTDTLRFSIPITKDFKQELEMSVAEEKQRIQPAILQNEVIDPCQDPFNAMFKMPDLTPKLTQDDINEYNVEVEAYYNDYENYLRIKLAKEIIDNRAYKFEFIICNDGTAPTGELSIFLVFPDNVAIYPYCKTFKWNKLIQPQKLTKFQRDMNRIRENTLIIRNPLSCTIPSSIEMVSMIDLSKKRESNTFIIESEGVKHHMSKELKIDDVVIDKLNAGNFSIEWKIIDTVLPQPVTGKLHVILSD